MKTVVQQLWQEQVAYLVLVLVYWPLVWLVNMHQLLLKGCKAQLFQLVKLCVPLWNPFPKAVNALQLLVGCAMFLQVLARALPGCSYVQFECF
jgi:hypothetical protein